MGDSVEMEASSVQSLLQDVSMDEGSVKFRRQAQLQRRETAIKSGFRLVVAIAICILWPTSIYMALTYGKSCPGYASLTGSYETGFDTDLEPARVSISLKKVKFTGDLKIDENGTVYRDVVGTQYVGRPSPEIDDAWVDIIRGGGVDLVGEEARSVAGKTYQKPGGWYLVGTNVFHQLHCLNKLRKATHPDYYTKKDFEPHANWRMHLDHCIDSIRQSLQCSADMSTILVEWNAARTRIVPNLEGVHTCRDFRRIQAWMLDKQRNAELHEVS